MIEWSITNKNVSSLSIRGKEIKSIERVSDREIIYLNDEDIVYFNHNTYINTDTILDVSLPANFELSYEFYTSGRSDSSPYVLIGDDNTHKLLIGQYLRTGSNGIGVYNGSSTGTVNNMGTSPLNEWITFTFVYDGETYYLTDGTNELSINSIDTIPLTKLLQVVGGKDCGLLKNIKIKAL